ncbi:hypothetical protein L210DRAFT_2067464 [Boletus edulis BED1]|uniref:Uncharacterized protein n=1 Tax=Boletus edulis BED1 TaxID=1328754 RepID=A0AAD4BW22_BOLED|nr:hypothetical protein L210DRAFT_2067464 [Boletus edulis BED1]
MRGSSGQLSLAEPWTIGCEEYNLYKEEARLSQYRKALGELEHLVVMRLFELTKASLTGTGYKLRQQISKALQRRSEAIRKAIARYNTQAVALNPPRPTISWKDITKYTILGEFDLLRQARDDVRMQEWARPAVREATAKFFKCCRAKEEIVRLNVEVRRLRTAILDEEKQISAVIEELVETDELLAIELRRRHRSRSAVNRLHLDRLDCIQRKYGDVGRALISRLAETSDGASVLHAVNNDIEGDNSVPDEASEVPDERPTQDYDFEVASHGQPTQDSESTNDIEDLYRMYINDPGDDDILDEEENTIGLRAMADFLHGVVD